MKIIKITFIVLLVAFAAVNIYAGQVAVHDPSVIIVYKDANGNSFPEQNAENSLTKYYFLMGTQLGAAYSQDMLNWTAFTPTLSINGQISTDYAAIFGENATWAGWSNNNDLKNNLWAADIIWNKDLKKWCMYYSLNGDDWHSSICMLASNKIESPYERVGSVVFGGMDSKTSGSGNNDFKKVTGQNTIPDRYMKDGGWGGTYGSSCIDPNVLYDENGQLWLVYGSWSGGIFVIKLDNKTGLRDYSYNYGVNPVNGAVWEGSRLRYDEYMGVHIAGGYYVSGEGPYIEYMKDADGEGYYYLFMSYGFYSPEGGYNMRLFRSKNITGPFIDVTGDDAVFNKAIYPNYGDNVTFGISLMQNYSWDWWTTDKNITDYGQVGGGQTAQGHNSALKDEDGKCYIIYHTKDNTGNGYGWHHVEVHPMVFTSDGWPLIAPFEARLGEYTNPDTLYKVQDIMGEYKVLTHTAVNYDALACNKPGTMRLNADKTISADYTGTWDYDYAGGKQFITLKTSVGTFNGTLLDQRMEDNGRKTLCLTAMNPANELCLWAYRKPQTKMGTETSFLPFFRIGEKAQSLVWDDKDKFLKVDAPDGDFEITFSFHNYNKTENNWDNWSLRFEENTDNVWALRADAYSISTFSGSTVTYAIPPTWNEFNDKDIDVKIIRQGASIHVSASVDGKDIYGALSKSSPQTALTVYLGGESTYLDIKKMSVASLKEREIIGTVTNYGAYKDKINAYSGAERTFSGDFKARYTFNNFHSTGEKSVWNNFIIRNTIDNQVGLIRSDGYQMDSKGSTTFTNSWGEDWDSFLRTLEKAKVDIDIDRTGSTITYTCHFNSYEGLSQEMVATQTGITADAVILGLTEEASQLDILSIMEQKTTKVEIEEGVSTPTISSNEQKITILPKITEDFVFIQLQKSNGTATLHGANGSILAKKATSTGEIVFNLSELPNGVYVITCEGMSEKVVKR
ncbi:MAG TPA: glycoside hydrolase family 43 protein [Paludibacteraceae bacterium]|nr:glycoside hydrolase family 43 protein [Paludibacteraceae bacterium]HQF49340.1 glycoside hydrolase family 43 protein [Paludibacteraceae bacterium]HQJ89095.1 glycoside hydrolase family 43 protein [Paludibacteraceae bacterium]